MRDLTPKQRKVLDYLIEHTGPCSPTEIGLEAGGQFYNHAASWACPALKVLVSRGLVTRNWRGHYMLAEPEEHRDD